MMVLMIGTLAACESDAAPTVDAPVLIDNAVAAADANTQICAVAGDCACFSSHDCPDGPRCENRDHSGTQVWCLPGPRGAGDVCVDGNDCRSSLCVDDEIDALRCSESCNGNSTCVATLPRCQFIGFGIDESICAPPANMTAAHDAVACATAWSISAS